MAMGTERSKALHNFTLPGDLRWGNQRFLRCIKVDSDSQVSPVNRLASNDSDSSDHRIDRSIEQRMAARDGERDFFASELVLLGSDKIGSAPPRASGGVWGSGGKGDGGVAAVREKVIFDLQTAADKMKDAIFKEGREGVASAEGESYRPWNLRTRRAACKTPASRVVPGGSGGGVVAGGNGGCGGGKREISQTTAAVIEKPSRLRSGGTVAAAWGGVKRERRKFSVSLSKSEIEEDFLALVNRRPPLRPKKRAKNVQRQLDSVFPGLWLTEVTADMYKVSEARRGL